MAKLAGLLIQRLFERSQRLFSEKHHANFFHRTRLVEKTSDLPNRNLGGLRHRITVGAGADRREGNGLQVPFGGELEAFPVARREFVGLAFFPAPVNRSDSMKDVLGLQPACLGHDRFTGLAFPHLPADTVEFSHDAGSGGAVNRPIHSGSAREPRISCVDDGVGFDEGDVALFKSNRFAGD